MTTTVGRRPRRPVDRTRTAGEQPAAETDDDARGRGPTLADSVGWLFVVLGFLIGSRPISDNSFLTHFANGRLIWNGAGIPRVDPYSFTAAGEPVTVQSWLATWVYVGLAQNFGDWSLRAFNGLLGALLVVSLWKLSEPARQLFPRVALVGAAVVVGAGLWTPRPLLFGLLAFCVVLHVLVDDLPAWTVLPVMWIWVNSHGSFPIALVLVTAVGFGRYLDDLRSQEGRKLSFLRFPWHELRVFGWVLGGTLLGAVNPLGIRLLTFPFELLSRREALENVAEWQPPTFGRPNEWGFALLMALAVIALIRRPGWRVAVPAAGFVALGLMATRNLPLASIVLVAMIAPWLQSDRLSVDGELRGLVPTGLRALAAAGLAGLLAITFTQGALDLRRFPVEEVDWLEERDLVANPDVPLVQRDIVGNYLEYRFGSRARVFMDDRFDFYPLDVLRDHDVLIFGGDYADVLDRHEAQVVLWRNEGEFVDWLASDDEWVIGYQTPSEELDADGTSRSEDEGWIVACRVGSEAFTRCN